MLELYCTDKAQILTHTLSLLENCLELILLFFTGTVLCGSSACVPAEHRFSLARKLRVEYRASNFRVADTGKSCVPPDL